MWLCAALAAVGDADTAAADRDALTRVVRGDHDALAEIYDRHVRLLYSLALRIVRRPTDAEDVIQEVFSQIWRQSARYDTARGTVAGWLVMVTRSRALDRPRRDRGRPAAGGRHRVGVARRSGSRSDGGSAAGGRGAGRAGAGGARGPAREPARAAGACVLRGAVADRYRGASRGAPRHDQDADAAGAAAAA